MQRFVRGLRQWTQLPHSGAKSVTTWSPGCDERHAVADALHDARALVAEHARRVAARIGARGGVQVGVADAARLEPDQHLARPSGSARSTSWTTSGRAELLEDCRANLHATILSSRRACATFSPGGLSMRVSARPRPFRPLVGSACRGLFQSGHSTGRSLMKFRTIHALVALAVVCAIAAVAGRALAVTSGSALAAADSVIHACKHPNGGWVRIIDGTASCRSREQAVSWNQEGPGGGGGVSKLGDLAGIPCTTEAGAAGKVELDFAGDDTVLFRCTAGGAPPPSATKLVINEVDYDQVGADGDGFVELKNTGTTAIDLTGYRPRLRRRGRRRGVQADRADRDDRGRRLPRRRVGSAERRPRRARADRRRRCARRRALVRGLDLGRPHRHEDVQPRGGHRPARRPCSTRTRRPARSSATRTGATRTTQRPTGPSRRP